MGVFNNMRNQVDNDFDSGDKELEEQYQRLFKKMARDFVLIDELRETVSKFNSLLDLIRKSDLSLSEDLDDDFEVGSEIAILKAIEYKENLERPRSKRQKYKDVTDER
tara:strand:- start:551 stop:874 length:324 start_codon:yes stop_codon:yes gene_type:complete